MKVDYTLYLCTDSGLMSCNTVEESVERAIQGGVSVVQLREKEASSRELFELAKRVKRVTDKYDVPLIINDRLDICLAVDAAGVHLGQTDLPCSEARRILKEIGNYWLGVLLYMIFVIVLADIARLFLLYVLHIDREKLCAPRVHR